MCSMQGAPDRSVYIRHGAFSYLAKVRISWTEDQVAPDVPRA